MDKYEIRRLNLLKIKDSHCGGSISKLANVMERDQSYVSRLLFEEGRKYKKNIADKAVSNIEDAFNLPRGWLDGLQESANIEFIGYPRNGEIKVIGDAVMGVDCSFDMDESLRGTLKFYSDDPCAFALRVRGDSMFPRINSGEFVVIEPKASISPSDEVFVRLKDGKNMIKKLGYHKEGFYQFLSVNQNHAPFTVSENEVDKVMFVSAIVKSSRFIDID